MKLFVRCEDRTVFEIDRKSLEAKTCSTYDPWCFNDPRKDVEYLSFSEWLLKSDHKRMSKSL